LIQVDYKYNVVSEITKEGQLLNVLQEMSLCCINRLPTENTQADEKLAL